MKTAYQKHYKRIIDFLFSVILIVLSFPLFLLLAMLIKITSRGPVIFKQKRVGRHGKVFTIYKFRTMVENAEKLKAKILYLNEADGPVFKIREDPRYTKFGKLLAHTGLDELPQLLNIIKGEMSFVGPRPLPVEEAEKIENRMRKKRESVLPGITSSWVVNGNHQLKFHQWMKLDEEYIKNISLTVDLNISLRTFLLVVSSSY